ncbi:hypothetical protein ACTXT7_004167 [Hymenolepis weldensis]
METQVSPQTMPSEGDEKDTSFLLSTDNTDGPLSSLGNFIKPQRKRSYLIELEGDQVWTSLKDILKMEK